MTASRLGSSAARRRMVAPVSRREAGEVEPLLGGDRGPDDVAVGERGRVAQVGEEVAAEERARGLLVEQARVPAMGDMRRVDPLHFLASEVEPLAVAQGPGRPIRRVGEPDGAPDAAVRRRRPRRRGEPRVHRAGLVRLDVAERDPPQPPEIENPGRRRGNGWKERSLAAVKEQRLLGVDQELVEGEARRRPRGRDEGREPVHAVGDLVDSRFHRCPPPR